MSQSTKHEQIYNRAYGMICKQDCAECRQGAMFAIQPKATEQEKQIKRVRSGIGTVVFDFCLQRVGQEFHAEELLNHVRYFLGTTPIAPDSPSRILRDRAKDGAVTYEVVDRSKSLYRITAVNL